MKLLPSGFRNLLSATLFVGLAATVFGDCGEGDLKMEKTK
jgi:hypothetical protein